MSIFAKKTCCPACSSCSSTPLSEPADQDEIHESDCRADDHHDHHDHCHGLDDDPHAAKKEIQLLVACALIFFGVMILSNQIQSVFGIWGIRIGYAIPYLLCGISIFRSAFDGMRSGQYLNEFTLMCGATVAAIFLGELPEAVGVMLFYRIGEFFQEQASAGSRRSIKNLLASKPSSANVLENGSVVTKPVEEVLVGQRVQVRAGEKIPLDGRVISGRSQVDQSPLTGESMPVDVESGSQVYGGSVNISGVLTVEVTNRFADTHMARILDMVEHAAMRKSPTERFITRFARYYTPAVVAAAFLVAVLPPLFIPGATFQTWVYRALVLLVISCPCALIISIPLGYFGGIGAASRKGILVKGGNVLDGLLHVDTVVFDKTGTLTQGVFDVSEVTPAPGISEQDLLAAALQAEVHSNHPIARSIQAHARKRGMSFESSVDPAASVREIPGKGMEAVVNGARYLAGTAALLADNNIRAEDRPHPGALVHVAKDSAYLGCILVNDSIRPEARQAVSDLSASGFKTFMLTGDRREAAAWVAGQIGLDGYRAELLPEDKVRSMQELSGSSRTAFVGDGINDAPILALSRVGIAMGGMGAEAAIEAADAVILNDSPAKIPQLFAVARDVRAIVWQNIILALGIKLSFMTLGIVGLSGLWEAIFADVGVALLAVLNSTRVMRK